MDTSIIYIDLQFTSSRVRIPQIVYIPLPLKVPPIQNEGKALYVSHDSECFIVPAFITDNTSEALITSVLVNDYIVPSTCSDRLNTPIHTFSLAWPHGQHYITLEPKIRQMGVREARNISIISMADICKDKVISMPRLWEVREKLICILAQCWKPDIGHDTSGNVRAQSWAQSSKQSFLMAEPKFSGSAVGRLSFYCKICKNRRSFKIWIFHEVQKEKRSLLCDFSWILFLKE